MVTQRENYHHGDLRQALIDAALELVAEKDVSSLSLREVARRVGVSHAAPYRHFEDKEALLVAVAQEGFGMLRHCIEEATQHIPNLLERLEAGCIAYVRYALEHPSHYRVMFGAYGAKAKTNTSLAEVAKQTYMPLVNAIAEGQSTGVMRAGDPEYLAKAVWASLHGLAMLLIDGQLPETESGAIESLSRSTTRLLMEGLLTSSPP